jgi:hypothetical protein
LIRVTPPARAFVLAALLLSCGQSVGETGQLTDASTGLGTTTGIPPATDALPTTTNAESTGTAEPATEPASTEADPPPDTGDESTTEATASTTTTTTTGTDTSDTTGTTGDPPCTAFACSPEFDQVLCDGEVVESCARGSFCVDDGCEPLSACDAAALLKRSEGCDFWAIKTELAPEAEGACFAVFVANTGDAPAHLSLAYGDEPIPVAPHTRIPKGQGQDLTFMPFDGDAGLPVGEVAILFLSRGPGKYPECPVAAAVPEETQIAGTARGRAFHITSDVPIAAYQTQPFGGGSGAVTAASLLLPTSVWDTSYIAVNAGPASDSGNPLLTLIAEADDTHITLRPKVHVEGGPGVDGGPAGELLEYTLDRGEALQINQELELTGSPVYGDKPFAVFGGSTCLNMPKDTYACDGAHQQIPPIHALGHTYAAVRYRDRAEDLDEKPPWRLVGAVSGTQLTWLPEKPSGAPDTLQLGQVVQFNAPGPFFVRSQDADHPFYASAYMTGGAPFNGTGDPDWVNLIPPDQFQRRYIFFTDPTYSETELVVVRRKVDGAWADVDLDCLGNPLVAWKDLTDDLQWTRVQLVTGNFKNVGNCSNGRRELKSANPFGVTVWGWGSAQSELFYTKYVSYAYPAGATIRQLNEIEVQ